MILNRADGEVVYSEGIELNEIDGTALAVGVSACYNANSLRNSQQEREPMIDPTTREQILTNAELVVSTMAEQLDVELDFDEQGVAWLDGYIERNREAWASDVDGLVSPLGSYLGECIVQTYGGDWAEVDGRIGVRFDEQNAAFPFSKVRKQIENGPEDSVHSFFTAIPVLFSIDPAE